MDGFIELAELVGTVIKFICSTKLLFSCEMACQRWGKSNILVRRSHIVELAVGLKKN